MTLNSYVALFSEVAEEDFHFRDCEYGWKVVEGLLFIGQH